MTEATEIFCKFQELWRAGTNARLSIECHAGKAWINLHVQLNQPPPPGPQSKQHHRRQGPSRVRRRERRKQERLRANIAAKAVTPCENSESGDALAQNDSVHIDNAAVEAASEDVLLNSFEAVAEKADFQVSEAEVAQCAPAQAGAEKHKLNVLAKPWSTHVQDELCSEEEYQQQSRASPRAPPNQCKICGKSFGSSKALNSHEMKYHQPNQQSGR